MLPPMRSFRFPSRLALFFALLLVALVAACGRGGGDSGRISAPGEDQGELPQFRLAAIAGGTLGPADLKGKVVVYDFWATWCGPCHVQAEILFALQPKLSSRGVEIVAVSLGEPEEVVREFLARKPYPFPVLTDPDDGLTAQLSIVGLPTLIVADREGNVVFRVTGIAGPDDIERAVERAGAA